MNARPRRLLLAILLVLLAPGHPEGAQAGAGDSLSHWGPVPPRADSVTAVFTRAPTPLWRSALYFPFRVVLFPLWLVDRGISNVAGFALESAVAEDVEEVFQIFPAPFGGRLYPTVAAGGLSGFGLGLIYEHDAFFRESNRYRLEFGFSFRGDLIATTGARLGEDERTTWDLGAGWRRRLNARFFGLGPESAFENESFYRQDYGWLGAEARHRLSRDWRLGGELLLSSSRARSTEPDDLSADDRDKLIEDKFDVSQIPGFGERSAGVTVAVSILRDAAPDRGRPGAGAYTELRLLAFHSLDGTDISYWNTRVDLQRFVPLWNSKQHLALRGFASWLDRIGNNEIPFQQLYTNGEPDGFRGYRDFRWRDEGALGATVEYRWPVWADATVDGTGLDIYLLTDVNQVFGSAEEIAWDHLRLSYGGGLRLAVTPFLLSRVEVAFSEDETVFRLVAGQNFQSSVERLFRGYEPVPGR